MKMNLLKNQQNDVSKKIWNLLNQQVKTMLAYMSETRGNVSFTAVEKNINSFDNMNKKLSK